VTSINEKNIKIKNLINQSCYFVVLCIVVNLCKCCFIYIKVLCRGSTPVQWTNVDQWTPGCVHLFEETDQSLDTNLKWVDRELTSTGMIIHVEYIIICVTL